MRRPSPVTIVFLVMLVIVPAAGGAWLAWSSSATWPVNRIASIARGLAEPCADQRVVQVSLSRRTVVVGCVEGDRRVLHTWQSGRRVTGEFGLPSGWRPFTLSDFDLDRAAALAARPEVRAVTIEPGEGALRIARVDATGTRTALTPAMLPG